MAERKRIARDLAICGLVLISLARNETTACVRVTHVLFLRTRIFRLSPHSHGGKNRLETLSPFGQLILDMQWHL